MLKHFLIFSSLTSLLIIKLNSQVVNAYIDPSDLDSNNSLNINDVNKHFELLFLNQNTAGDINEDGAVNLVDSVILLNSILEPPSKAKIPLENNDSKFKLVFSEDFNKNVVIGSFPQSVSNKWKAYPYPWQDTSKKGFYYPEKVVSFKDGVMNMFIHSEVINGVNKHLVAAPQPKLNTGIGNIGDSLMYGKIIVRFRSDPLPLYKTAWLLWPDSNRWPKDGEIDFPEGNLDSNINAFMHKQNAVSGSDQAAFGTQTKYNDWHTAIIEWLPNKCTFTLDGVLIGTSTDRVPSTPMHYVLQTETALESTHPDYNTQGNVQIDWLVIYSYVN